mmetsp:Transcript_10409/g.14438  ORF Transcript_10409/g.14438 Transcript_10409/m.14438 type:complete len:1520 (+) Transcript_10409:290-4849(+)|eukprot:CAMPEP_0184481962 /NCGR_PEP_ID=MMETSP0113_2-20130426/3555_1 /TAXON_ID=91329 /ORGANISM="Norrisiella sphaerica, Strain BC52" /LENGTH=1519 /DNA_ID=CAMNT_0026861455 /DNA_START=307 /DNA_END=4866 /DNA_ORIENTATION=+
MDNVLRDSKVLKEGHLEKRRNFGFHKQYFWVIDRLAADGKKERFWLAYDRDRACLSPEHVTSLADLKIEPMSQRMFRLSTPYRKFVLRGVSAEDTKSWRMLFSSIQDLYSKRDDSGGLRSPEVSSHKRHQSFSISLSMTPLLYQSQSMSRKVVDKVLSRIRQNSEADAEDDDLDNKEDSTSTKEKKVAQFFPPRKIKQGKGVKAGSEQGSSSAITIASTTASISPSHSNHIHDRSPTSKTVTKTGMSHMFLKKSKSVPSAGRSSSMSHKSNKEHQGSTSPDRASPRSLNPGLRDTASTISEETSPRSPSARRTLSPRRKVPSRPGNGFRVKLGRGPIKPIKTSPNRMSQGKKSPESTKYKRPPIKIAQVESFADVETGSSYYLDSDSSNNKSPRLSNCLPSRTFQNRIDVVTILEGYLQKRRKGLLKLHFRTQYFWLIAKAKGEANSRNASTKFLALSPSARVSVGSNPIVGKGSMSPRAPTRKQSQFQYSWNDETQEMNQRKPEDGAFGYYLAYDDDKNCETPAHIVPLTNCSMSVDESRDLITLRTSKRTYYLKMPARLTDKLKVELRNLWVQKLSEIAEVEEEKKSLLSPRKVNARGNKGNIFGKSETSPSLERHFSAAYSREQLKKGPRGGQNKRSPIRKLSQLPPSLIAEIEKGNSEFISKKSSKMETNSMKKVKRTSKNNYFADKHVLKEGFLEKKTKNIFSQNIFRRHYVWIYRSKTGSENGTGSMSDSHLLGISSAPSMKRPKHVVSLRKSRLEHNFLRGYIRLITQKEEFKFRATESEEAEWLRVMTKVTKASKREKRMQIEQAIGSGKFKDGAEDADESLEFKSGVSSMKSAKALMFLENNIEEQMGIDEENLRTHMLHNKSLVRKYKDSINYVRMKLGLSKISKEDAMIDSMIGKGIPSCGLWDPGLISGDFGPEFRAVGFCDKGLNLPKSYARSIDQRTHRDALRDWFSLSKKPVVLVTIPKKQLFEIEDGQSLEALTEAAAEAKVRLLFTADPEDQRPRSRPIANNYMKDLFESESGRSLLMKFLMKEMSAENLIFLEANAAYEEEFGEAKRRMKAQQIYEVFIAAGAEKQVNLPIEIVRRIEEKLKKERISNLLFSEAAEAIMQLMQRDSIMRFRKTKECREFIEELHGNDEDFFVRDCEPYILGLQWLHQRIRGAISFGSSRSVLQSLAAKLPSILLARHSSDHFWSKVLLPTKAVVPIPIRGVKKHSFIWALNELMKPERQRRASEFSEALTQLRLEEACATAIDHFHSFIPTDSKLRCPFLKNTLARYYIKRLNTFIGEEALAVFAVDKLPPWDDFKALEIVSCQPNWRNPGKLKISKSSLSYSSKSLISRFKTISSRLTVEEIMEARASRKLFERQNAQNWIRTYKKEEFDTKAREGNSELVSSFSPTFCKASALKRIRSQSDDSMFKGPGNRLAEQWTCRAGFEIQRFSPSSPSASCTMFNESGHARPSSRANITCSMKDTVTRPHFKATFKSSAATNHEQFVGLSSKVPSRRPCRKKTV